MEVNKMEVAVIEEAVAKSGQDQIQVLNELQLAFVGGGIAELVGC